MRNGDRIQIRPVRRSGFTLMELLVVLVIIGLLAALVGPTIYKRINPAKQAVARAQIDNFGKALDGFFIDVGRYPTTQEGLAALRTRPQGVTHWKGPYLTKPVPLDPWGYAYHYQAPGSNAPYQITTYGADGKPGGTGKNRDISS